MRIATELKKQGCHLPVDQFADRLVEILHNFYRAYTVDRLVQDPDEAKQYCNRVRLQLSCDGLMNTLILRCLMNRRKSGR